MRKERAAHTNSREASRLWRRRWVAARRHARFELAGRLGKLRGNFPQEFRAAPLRLGCDFLLDVPAQPRQLFVDALAKLFKFIHRCVRRTGRGDFGIIGMLRECRKEESWRFPINGNIGWTAGKTRCKIFSAAAASSRAPSSAQTEGRWSALAPRAATSAAPT